MRFIIINPRKQAMRTVKCRDAGVAQQLAGLTLVDHGTVQPGLAIAVGEDTLTKLDAASGEYFALHGRLYAGNAMLYAYDPAGETCDINDEELASVAPEYFASEAAIEAAIAAGRVERPEVSIEGTVLWLWPSKDTSWRERAAQLMAAAMKNGGSVLIDNDTMITTVEELKK